MLVLYSIVLCMYACSLYTLYFLYCLLFSATSPGKLLQYLVEDGCHIDAKEPYAEIEVCIVHAS